MVELVKTRRGRPTILQLSENEIIDIYNLCWFDRCIKLKEIASKHNISISTVTQIKFGEKYNEVTGHLETFAATPEKIMLVKTTKHRHKQPIGKTDSRQGLLESKGRQIVLSVARESTGMQQSRQTQQ